MSDETRNAECEMRNVECGMRNANHESRITNHESRITNHERSPSSLAARLSPFWSFVWLIARKDFKPRFKGAGFFIMLALYLLANMSICGLILRTWWTSRTAFPAGASPQKIQELFDVLVGALLCMQAAAIALMSPVLASLTIAGERQRKTLDDLLMTLIPTEAIAWGKAVSVFWFVSIFALTTMPIAVLTMLGSQFSPGTVLICEFGMVIYAFFCACIGVWASATFRSVAGCVSGALLLVWLPILFMAGGPFSWLILVLMGEWNVPFFSVKLPPLVLEPLILLPLSVLALYSAGSKLAVLPQPVRPLERILRAFAYPLWTLIGVGFVYSTKPSLPDEGLIAVLFTYAVLTLLLSGTASQVSLYRLAIDGQPFWSVFRSWFSPKAWFTDVNTAPVYALILGLLCTVAILIPAPFCVWLDQAAFQSPALLWGLAALVTGIFMGFSFGLLAESRRMGYDTSVNFSAASAVRVWMVGMMAGFFVAVLLLEGTANQQPLEAVWTLPFWASPLMAVFFSGMAMVESEQGLWLYLPSLASVGLCWLIILACLLVSWRKYEKKRQAHLDAASQ